MRSSSNETDVDADDQAARIVEYDIATGDWKLVSDPLRATRAVVLLRHDGRTVGIERFDRTIGSPDEIPNDLKPATPPIRRWGEPHTRPSATVVVCTLGSNPILRQTVEALLAQEVGADGAIDYDLVVVDNAPASGRTRRMLEGLLSSPRLRVVDEPRRGLSWARNSGVRAATGEVVAFTDDDAVPDAAWLRSLVEVFSVDALGAIGGVTGLVVPAELAYPAQRWFEEYGGFSKGPEVVVWSLRPVEQISKLGCPGEGGPLFPITTARVGAGASMAFRRSVLDEIGPFDCALGAGTASEGGEDLDAFARVLYQGYCIVYTPDAVVWHTHRRTLRELETQLHGNGAGMAALLTKSVLTRPSSILRLAIRSWAILRRVSRGSERNSSRSADFPKSLSRAEFRGFLRGPSGLVRAHWNMRRTVAASRNAR